MSSIALEGARGVDVTEKCGLRRTNWSSVGERV